MNVSKIGLNYTINQGVYGKKTYLTSPSFRGDNSRPEANNADSRLPEQDSGWLTDSKEVAQSNLVQRKNEVDRLKQELENAQANFDRAFKFYGQRGITLPKEKETIPSIQTMIETAQQEKDTAMEAYRKAHRYNNDFEARRQAGVIKQKRNIISILKGESDGEKALADLQKTLTKKLTAKDNEIISGNIEEIIYVKSLKKLDSITKNIKSILENAQKEKDSAMGKYIEAKLIKDNKTAQDQATMIKQKNNVLNILKGNSDGEKELAELKTLENFNTTVLENHTNELMQAKSLKTEEAELLSKIKSKIETTEVKVTPEKATIESVIKEGAKTAENEGAKAVKKLSTGAKVGIIAGIALLIGIIVKLASKKPESKNEK